MLYQPNFCCHCGEKIARATWTPLTSRRFCDFCAVEQKQHDLLPRAGAVLALLIGAVGMAAYFGSGSPPPKPIVAAAARDGKRVTAEIPARQSSPELPKAEGPDTPPASASNAAPANIKQRPVVTNSSTEPVYYCGAMTKKGTPCTRRVKTPGRCWQHLGQPAMTSLQR